MMDSRLNPQPDTGQNHWQNRPKREIECIWKTPRNQLDDWLGSGLGPAKVTKENTTFAFSTVRLLGSHKPIPILYIHWTIQAVPLNDARDHIVIFGHIAGIKSSPFNWAEKLQHSKDKRTDTKQ